MTAALSESMVTRVSAVLSQYYTGAALVRNTKVLQDHIRADSPGKIRYLDGGVNNVVFQAVTIAGLRANCNATLTAWAVFAQDQGSTLVRAYPHNDVAYSFTLTKASGRWLIDSEKWFFMPGSEP
jgi:hypothetical protein